jgi:hypothetical protein
MMTTIDMITIAMQTTPWRKNTIGLVKVKKNTTKYHNQGHKKQKQTNTTKTQAK